MPAQLVLPMPGQREQAVLTQAQRAHPKQERLEPPARMRPMPVRQAAQQQLARPKPGQREQTVPRSWALQMKAQPLHLQVLRERPTRGRPEQLAPLAQPEQPKLLVRMARPTQALSALPVRIRPMRAGQEPPAPEQPGLRGLVRPTMEQPGRPAPQSKRARPMRGPQAQQGRESRERARVLRRREIPMPARRKPPDSREPQLHPT